SAVISAQEDYEIVVIDQRVDHCWKRSILQHLDRRNGETLFVGLTVMTGEPIKYALEISSHIKKYYPVPIVWGGIHPTLMPEQTLRHNLVDYVIRDKAEYSLLKFANFLQQKIEITQVPGLCYIDENNHYMQNDIDENFNWEMLPPAPYDLVDHSKYYRSGFEKKILSIMTSRNCPHRCTFCYNSSLKSKTRWSPEPVEHTTGNLKNLIQKYDPQYISFIDDDFFVSKSRAQKILKFLLRYEGKFKIGFRGARVDDLLKLDDRFLELLVSVNTKHINIGVESGSQRILHILQKGIRPEMVVELNRRLSKYPSIIPLYNFFSGIPSETENDIKLSTQLILKLTQENKSCQISGFHQYTPYPGSELFQEAIKNGFRAPLKLEGWSKMQLESNSANCPWIDKKRQRLLNMIYSTVYFIDKKYEMYF
ncbi:MAG: B12-binding domain-containing radical SAM protein, partial [Oligoflexia bacterium]|nr:B12-binding domain-containing radical SAM protein [Oligoflexia bacterium]